MEPVPCHDTGQEFRTIQYWPARVIEPMKRLRHRCRRGTTFPHHRRRPDVKPQPLHLCMHSALSGVFLVLPRWMERQGREHASHPWELYQPQQSIHAQLLEPTEI